jgi:hypothetical protein
MAHQISEKGAKTLSIEENSFFIVYKEVNIQRRHIFAGNLFFRICISEKMTFFGKIFMIHFKFLTFLLDLQNGSFYSKLFPIYISIFYCLKAFV